MSPLQQASKGMQQAVKSDVSTEPLGFCGYLLFCQGSLSAKTVKIKVERLANI